MTQFSMNQMTGTQESRLIQAGGSSMGTKTLVSFLALTFGLSWVPMSLFMLFADQFTALFGEMSSTNPLFLLAVYAPGISGIFLIWHHYITG